MVGGQTDVKLVSNAMANATRRKIMATLVEKDRTREEVEQAAGGSMLDYHLQMLQQAGLIEIKEDAVVLTDFGKNFMETKAGKPAEAKKDLAGTKPLEVVELRQLLPCIADSTKFRIIARFEPPLGGALNLLEPLFPRARYSEKIGALIIQKGNILITIYSTGNVTMTMIKSEEEARETLEDLKKTINRGHSQRCDSCSPREDQSRPCRDLQVSSQDRLPDLWRAELLRFRHQAGRKGDNSGQMHAAAGGQIHNQSGTHQGIARISLKE